MQTRYCLLRGSLVKGGFKAPGPLFCKGGVLHPGSGIVTGSHHVDWWSVTDWSTEKHVTGATNCNAHDRLFQHSSMSVGALVPCWPTYAYVLFTPVWWSRYKILHLYIMRLSYSCAYQLAVNRCHHGRRVFMFPKQSETRNALLIINSENKNIFCNSENHMLPIRQRE